MTQLIAPHGGTLINRTLEGQARADALRQAATLKTFTLTEREISDLELLAHGGFSPLTGFMTKDDYDACLDKKVLASGLPWTIPVVKQLTASEKSAIQVGDEVALADARGRRLAILHVEEIFAHDKAKHALEVYGTDEAAHPGVAHVLRSSDWLVGGPVQLVEEIPHEDFARYRLTPSQTRELFKSKGWHRIVAFQTRNPVHRAHEYIQKCALEIVDGLLLHPLVGQTKGDDISAEVRMQSYELMLEKYYPKDRVVMTVFPAAMRYAGPREAIFHALVRKNYGCSHFIVGRDHAGVSRPGGGGYYGSFDAHSIFDEFDPQDLGITPLFFDFTFYCKTCGGMASYKTCPHDATAHVALSGSKVREMLAHGEMPPPEFTRPEVAQVLIDALRK